MRKLIIILILSLIPVACEWEYGYEVEIGEITDYNFENDIPEFETIDQVLYYVHYNIKHTKDINDYWQTPEETYYRYDENLNKMLGDCEDHALFFSYLLYTKLDVNSEIIIVKGYLENHVITYIPSIDKYIDSDSNCDFGNSIKKEILQRIPYMQAIWMALNYHINIK
jgi:hypothetical protein